ncbi:MAG: hypothetical protein OSB14_02935 [Planctomycetota bacterium]|nr:hypothetical protein [Planctomycetota bacterium]
MTRRNLGRALVGTGIAVLLWAVLAFCNTTIGGPPSNLHFANRRSYTEIKQATHSGFLPLAAKATAGMLILLVGSWVLKKDEDAS